MKKSVLLASVAHPILGRMSAAEMAKGRYMRAPDGHEAPAPSPTPTVDAPAAPAAEPAADDRTTEQQLDDEFLNPGDVAPATPGADADAATTDEDGPTDLDDQGQPKQGQSAQERIDELTGARREADRQAAEARREADYWRGKAEGAAPPLKEGGEERDPGAEPDAKDYEYGEADPLFIKDSSRYHARQEFQTQQQAAEFRGEIAQMEAAWTTRIADPELVKQYPDFDEKVTKGGKEGKWDCSPIMALGIKNSEFGPDIAYHLATNTGEATRIAQLTPMEQAREFGRMEGERIAAKKSAGQPQPRTVTETPAPPSARARGAGGRFAVDAETDDFAAFETMADGVLKG